MAAITLIASISVFAQDNGTSAEWGYVPPKNSIQIDQNPNKTIQKGQHNPSGEFIITKSGRSYDATEKFYGKIVVTDSTLNFEQLGKTDIYRIEKKRYINGNTLYNVSNLKNPESKEEFLLNQEYNYFEYSVVVERISGSKIVDTKLYFFNKHVAKQEDRLRRSFGGVMGYSTFLGTVSASSASYGGYVDFGYFGLEYHGSASLNNNLNDIDKYLNGQTNEYVAGGASMNFGFFSKFTPKKDGSLYLGLGAQSYTEISAKNVTQSSLITVYNSILRRYETRTQTTTTPQVVEDRKIIPYFTIVYLAELGETFTFKGGIIVSKTIMLNVGVGYNF